jgi:hypothetical protein
VERSWHSESQGKRRVAWASRRVIDAFGSREASVGAGLGRWELGFCDFYWAFGQLGHSIIGLNVLMGSFLGSFY